MLVSLKKNLYILNEWPPVGKITCYLVLLGSKKIIKNDREHFNEMLNSLNKKIILPIKKNKIRLLRYEHCITCPLNIRHEMVCLSVKGVVVALFLSREISAI